MTGQYSYIGSPANLLKFSHMTRPRRKRKSAGIWKKLAGNFYARIAVALTSLSCRQSSMCLLSNSNTN